MKKYLQYLLFFIVTLLVINSSFITSYGKSEEETSYISLDFLNKDELPSNFRTSLDTDKINSNLNISGLENLNIAGSAEFTELSIIKAKEAISSEYPIYIVDLRQESHGFINGNAVSLYSKGDKINAGFPLNAVLKREDLFLKLIPLNRTIYLDIDKYEIIPKTVYNEETLVTNNDLNYFRIPVTDNERPTDDMVDRFLKFIDDLPENKWLYFHCKAGDGRTTTFMILYDIINNYKTVSLEDIIERQVALASLNENKFDRNKLRYEFIENFYKYAKNSNFDVTWSQWVKSNNITPFTLINEKK